MRTSTTCIYFSFAFLTLMTTSTASARGLSIPPPTGHALGDEDKTRGSAIFSAMQGLLRAEADGDDVVTIVVMNARDREDALSLERGLRKALRNQCAHVLTSSELVTTTSRDLSPRRLYDLARKAGAQRVFAIYLDTPLHSVLIREINARGLSDNLVAIAIDDSPETAETAGTAQHRASRRPPASPHQLNAFRRRAISIVPLATEEHRYLPVHSEPNVYILPSGDEVHSVRVLEHLGEQELADKRKWAMGIEWWSVAAGLSIGLTAAGAGMIVGGLVGYASTSPEEEALPLQVGMLLGAGLGTLVTLPVVLFLKQLPKNISPSEELVQDRVRLHNIRIAKELSIDVVDMPFRYLGE